MILLCYDMILLWPTSENDIASCWVWCSPFHYFIFISMNLPNMFLKWDAYMHFCYAETYVKRKLNSFAQLGIPDKNKLSTSKVKKLCFVWIWLKMCLTVVEDAESVLWCEMREYHVNPGVEWSSLRWYIRTDWFSDQKYTVPERQWNVNGNV